MSDYTKNKVLDHVLGTASWTMPADCYMALFTTNPNDDASGTEVTGTGYAREAITHAAASGGIAENNADVIFTAGGSWGTVTHAAIFDALTTGNMLLYGALGESRAMGDGDELKFRPADINWTAN